MAISNVVQFQTAIDTAATAEMTGAISGGAASAAESAIYAQAKAAGAEMYVNEYGVANAFRVVEGGAGAAGTGTATEILQFEAVTNGAGEVTGANIVKMPAQGTTKAGALSGQVPIGTVAAGVAIGAGIGLKEAATHRQFWEDVVSIGDGINSPEQTIQVIWRMMQDGSIQSYCDKRTVDKLIHRMYELQAFDAGSVTPVLPAEDTGLMDVPLGSPGIGVLKAAASAAVGTYPVPVAALEAAYLRARQIAGARPYNAMGAVCEDNSSGYGIVVCSVVNVLDNNLYVEVSHESGNPDPVQLVSLGQNPGKIEYIGASYVRYNAATGEIDTVSDSGYMSYWVTRPNRGRASSFGCVVTEPNPNVNYNPANRQAPKEESDFWNVFTEWLANSLQQPGYNPLNNAIVPTTWIPFTMPNINWQIDPATGVQPDIWTGTYPFPDPFANPGADPAPDADPWIWRGIGDYIVPHIDIPTPTPTPWDDSPGNDPVKPNNPFGSTPAITAPTSGISNALFTVYNPTQANVDALGAYLWTQNIIELISQFFQNPLDAIISLHLVYCTPTTGTAKNIKLGYLDSGVSAATVTSQYVEIACGDVAIPEMYHNALDYNNVDLQVFLPFIGFRKLSTKELMGAILRITYTVDVYTGICLAKLYAVRPGVSQLLYTFEGNCAIDIPLTSADRSRMISGLITAGLSAVTGNPAGVVGGIASIHTDIERSGGFSGNAGAMGVKKPYVIIKRAVSAQATNYAKQYGYPLNKSAKLASFKGFTRCQSVHVDIPYATREEMDVIHAMLTTGVII